MNGEFLLVAFFIRDITIQLEWNMISNWLETGWIRVSLALSLIWLFIGVNIRGARSYERAIIPMMFLMFALGAIVILAGFNFNHEEFEQAISVSNVSLDWKTTSATFNWKTLFAGSAILFSSFIGFDSIAQAGGEAKNPGKTLPISIGLAIGIVGGFYFLFTSAVYHAVPWQYIASEAQHTDITAPGVLSYLLPTGFGIAIFTGAAIALINDLPAMFLSVSRLMFAWAEDGIFPKFISRIHKEYHTPYMALIMSGLFASIGVLGSHYAGDFFLGIDIMVISMMVNFLLMCITIITIDRVNPHLAGEIKFCKDSTRRNIIGWLGIILLCLFIGVHIWKDFQAEKAAWYFHSIPIWLLVMSGASIIFFRQRGKLTIVPSLLRMKNQ